MPVQLQNDYDQVTTRIDHNLSSKDRLMGRYSYINEPYFQAGYAPLSGKEAPLRDNGVVVQYTRVVSPRAVNEFRFSYTRSAAGYTQEPVSQNLDAADRACRIQPPIRANSGCRASRSRASAASAPSRQPSAMRRTGSNGPTTSPTRSENTI